MAVAFFRTIIMYILILGIMRFSGKRQLGELQISELVVTVLISELAAIPMQDFNAPVLRSAVAMITLVALEIIVSFLSVKSLKFRTALEGHPCVLIENGKINQKEMQLVRFSIDDLMEALHQNGITGIDKVNAAILETSGKLSVFPKASELPVTPKDMNITVTETEIPYTIISDGKIVVKNMDKLKLTRRGLDKLIKRQGYKSIKEIFYMSMTKDNEQYIIRRDKN